MNLGQIATGYNSFNKGADEESARQRLATDRLYQDEQRARLRKTQGEDDAVKDDLRAASAAVPQIEAQQADPFEVDGGGAVNPGFKFQDKFYADRGLADSARTQAQGQAAQGVYAKAGRFEDARRLDTAETQAESAKLGLASARKTDQRGDEDYARKKTEVARLMRKEGAFASVEAMAKGDLDGFMEASAAGDWRPIAGTVKITPAESMVGGVKTRSYNWSFQVKGPNGEIRDMDKNSLEMQREIQPYATQLQQNRDETKALLDDRKTTVLERRADANDRYVELRGELGAARIDVARARGQGGGNDRTQRDENAKKSLDIRARQQERLDIEGQRKNLLGEFKEGAIKRAEYAEKKAALDTKEAALKKREDEAPSLPTSSVNAPSPGLADAKPSKPAEPAAMPKAKTELKAGQVYQTARGPAKWNGAAFEAQ